MISTRTIVGGLCVGLALGQTGCAALGIAMVGAPTTPVETAHVSDPSAITVGAPTERGNSNVTVKLNMPAYQTQYTRQQLDNLVVGLLDMDSAAGYFGYAGESTVEPGYHAAIHQMLADPTYGMPSGFVSPKHQDFKRYLYYATGTAIRNTTPPSTVTFTNVRPSTTGKVVAFAAAFSGGTTKAHIVGFTVSPATPVGTTNFTFTAPLNVSLDIGLVTIGGNVSIVEKPPAASVQ
jgi:hypothetical protein